MFPGAMRLDRNEEDAAVAAVRELMRAKKLFRFYGVSPFQRSRVRQLERAFAARIGVARALAVNSGTSALVCGLTALGIGPGDEVIVPAYTWFSTASAVLAVGAVPVLAEVNESLNLDPGDVRRKLSPHTRALIPVHMRGAPAPMDEIMDLARQHGLRVLEDVAQATGGSFRGRALGSIGDAGAFSFQMSKIMTAGEGGMLTTADADVHRRAAMYHDAAACPDLGIPLEEWLPGVNLRMSELHAAVLLVQLGRVEALLADMRARKAQIKEAVRARLESRGATFRTLHDEAGDTAIALIFFLPEASRTTRVTAALADDNIPASRLYQDMKLLPRDYIDLHAYSTWAPILQKRTWTADAGPWRRHPRDIAYSAEMCPRTMDLLRRAVHIDVSPQLKSSQVEQMAAGIVDAVERYA